MKILNVLMITLMTCSFFHNSADCQVLRVTGNKVGILDNTPSYPLDVNGNIRTTADIRANWFRINGSKGLYSTTYGTFIQATNADYWSIRSNGGLYIRSKSNVLKGSIAHNGTTFGLKDANGHWSILIAKGSHTSFRISNINRMKLSSNGNLDVAQIRDWNDLSYYLNPAGVSRLKNIYPKTTNTGYIGSNANRWFRGYFTNMHRVTEHVLSDKRMKENIAEINDPLSMVMSLSGKIYNYKSEVTSHFVKNYQTPGIKEANANDEAISDIDKKELLIIEQDISQDGNTFGFIAQDVQKVIPELVSYDKENDIYSMNYSAIIPLLVESTKLQQKQIEKQEKLLEMQKQQIQELIAKLKK